MGIYQKKLKEKKLKKKLINKMFICLICPNEKKMYRNSAFEHISREGSSVLFKSLCLCFFLKKKKQKPNPKHKTSSQRFDMIRLTCPHKEKL